MFIPFRKKEDHQARTISIKSINNFIEAGLKIVAAKPALHFHQTLTFAKPIYEAKPAKVIFNKFMKAVIKQYGKQTLAALHIQERRWDGSQHFHVCFLIFAPDKFKFAPSRVLRDFRADLYKRWNALNNGESVHEANKLIPHDFNFESIYYFCRTLEIADAPPKRAETNWWGLWNKDLVNNCRYKPSKAEIKRWFNAMFKRTKKGRGAQPNEEKSNCPDIGTTEIKPYDAAKEDLGVKYCLKRGFDEFYQPRERCDFLSMPLINLINANNSLLPGISLN